MKLVVIATNRTTCNIPKISACKIFPFINPRELIRRLAINPRNRISSVNDVLNIEIINRMIIELGPKSIALNFPVILFGSNMISLNESLVKVKSNIGAKKIRDAKIAR